MTDAAGWLPQNQADRIRLALRDLQAVHYDYDVQAAFIEGADVAWPNEWPTGDAMFFPGQFKDLFNVARQPEGNIYFAGEHLSVHHTWIAGAIDSALNACQQILGFGDVTTLRPKALRDIPLHDYDYSPLINGFKPTTKPRPDSAEPADDRRWFIGKP